MFSLCKNVTQYDRKKLNTFQHRVKYKQLKEKIINKLEYYHYFIKISPKGQRGTIFVLKFKLLVSNYEKTIFILFLQELHRTGSPALVLKSYVIDYPQYFGTCLSELRSIWGSLGIILERQSCRGIAFFLF